MRIGLSALTFTGSGTQNILVAIVDNNIIEDSESFTVILTNPQPDNNVVFDPDTIMITIIDDDEREFLNMNFYLRLRTNAYIILLQYLLIHNICIFRQDPCTDEHYILEIAIFSLQH